MAEELRLAVGQVSYAGPEGCGVWFDREYRELPLFGPAGIRYQPREGQRALLLSGREGCALLGVLSPGGAMLPPGEIRLECGGGWLHLKQNGDVVINGVTITKDGQILPKEGS